MNSHIFISFMPFSIGDLKLFTGILAVPLRNAFFFFPRGYKDNADFDMPLCTPMLLLTSLDLL